MRLFKAQREIGVRILFVHQNFPGQFPHLAPALVQRGHDVIALTADGNQRQSPVPVVRYKLDKKTFSFKDHALATHFAEQSHRGAIVGRAAHALKEQRGLNPDIVIGHPGWGETMYLKEVWPDAKHVMYAEFFYSPRGLDVDFDKEFYKPALQRDFWITSRQAPQLLTLNQADAILSPTQWQASTYPRAYREKIHVIHDGVDLARMNAPQYPMVQLAGSGLTFRPGDEVLTFLARNLEPYRGYHIFMRALPAVLAARPNAHVIIVGNDGVSYGAPAPEGTTWKQIFLNEAGDRIDKSRVHFTGQVPHNVFVNLMHVSRVHTYLTYPFVLSWSMLEAMGAGALICGSNTPPVREVIEHGKNGLLFDFFDIDGLAKTLIEALANPDKYAPLRAAAKKLVEDKYDLHRHCLPAQIKLVESLF